MRKILLIFILVFNVLCVSAETIRGDYPKDKIIKNKYIQIAMPGAIDGIYQYSKRKNIILFYDKTQKKKNLVFAIKISNKADNLKKSQKIIGQFKDKKDSIYNVILSRPTLSEEEFENKSPSYRVLYNIGEFVKISYTKKVKEIF